MWITRRTFLRSCALGAGVLGVADCSASTGKSMPARGAALPGPREEGPDTVYRPLTAVALDTARSLGSSYADIRIARYRDQSAYLRTQAEFGATKIQHVPYVSDSESFGFGIRVLV